MLSEEFCYRKVIEKAAYFQHRHSTNPPWMSPSGGDYAVADEFCKFLAQVLDFLLA